MEKFTKIFIKLFIVYVLATLMFSCRAVKKEYLQENYASKEDVSNLEQTQLNSLKALESKIESTIITKVEEKIKKSTEKQNEKQNENTTVTGTLKAEEGKEKSATIGNTTIKSNGADIQFQVNSSKEITKEVLTELQELKQSKQEMLTIITKQQETIEQNTKAISELKALYETEKAVKTKEVKKSGLTFTTLSIIAIILIVLYLIYRFKEKIKTLLLIK